MSDMTTLEMIEAAFKEPGIIFIANNNELRVSFKEAYSTLCIIRKDGSVESTIYLSPEIMGMTWHREEKEVPWQEALQARLDGKTVECRNCEGCKNGDCGAKESQIFNTPIANLCSICWAQISTGHWFIRDDADA